LEQLNVTRNAYRFDKNKKQSKNLLKKRKQPRFGICFDVDGVLARGTLPLPQAIKAFRKLVDDKGDLNVPVAFVTNALNRNEDKASQISGWMDVQIDASQMVQAQGPLEVFKGFHDKFCLVIGQGKVTDIAKELGFKDICVLDELIDAYPLLDMVNHDNRKRIAIEGYVEKKFRKVEAIVLMGEPKHWESSLQLLVDLLKTDGKPDHAPEAVPETHLPVIACNMDLQFMDRACMPRYGHGAYLLCLEALYKKVTGKPLQYTSLVGKPSEITMRFAEHVLTRESRRLGYDEPLKRIYLIGDTPEVDIVGSNLYQRYIKRLRERQQMLRDSNIESSAKDIYLNEIYDPELPESRQIPKSATLSKQTVDQVESLLVCTGVYKPNQSHEEGGDEKNYQGHRDFPRITELYRPTHTFTDVNEAIDYILEKEQCFT